MKIAVIYLELLLLTLIFVCAPSENVKNKLFWYNHNYELIKQRVAFFNLKPESLVRVKNVILFVGDGMGMTTVTASRVYKRQKLNHSEAKLIFDEFPASALIQTDIANSQFSESAAAATALFCGVKTNFENLGADASVAAKEACSNIDSHVQSIISWAQKKNLKTGFVTTARVTHATPAALYAHSGRHIEDDTKQNGDCKDIARQLIEDEPGRKINVIMGGGLRSLTSGRRIDGRNLTSEWLENHENSEFVADRFEMLNISDETENLLGIFSTSHMHYNADRDAEKEPSLAEMTKTAIDVLKRNNKLGFLLVVEAGKIDFAHHNNNAYRALEDTLALDEAVEVAVRSLDLSESMVIVTADHGSAVTYSGFATSKNHSVLGMDKFVSNVNKKPYQLILYASGLGHDHYNESLASKDFRNSYHKATIPSTWANHAGDDVPLYAVGSLANILFGGSMDQTYVPHAIAFAMCLFDYQDRCFKRRPLYPVELPRFKKVSKIHQLKQKLNEALEDNKTEEKSSLEAFESLKNETELETSGFVNETEIEFFATSDLTGNFTEDTAGQARIRTDCKMLFCLLVVLLSIITC